MQMTLRGERFADGAAQRQAPGAGRGQVHLAQAAAEAVQQLGGDRHRRVDRVGVRDVQAEARPGSASRSGASSRAVRPPALRLSMFEGLVLEASLLSAV